MTKHYCDCCNTETTDLYEIPIYGFTKTYKSTQMMRAEKFCEIKELCFLCYKELITPLWQSFTEKQIEYNNKNR